MLNLAQMSMDDEYVATLRYDVVHNVAALRTTVDVPLTFKVNTRDGKVTGSMTFDKVEAQSLDAAISKLATWCERVGAALRAARRLPDSELPLFEHSRFDLDGLLPWQRVLYKELLDSLRSIDSEEFSSYFAALKAEHHPLVLVSDALDIARATVEREREDS